MRSQFSCWQLCFRQFILSIENTQTSVLACFRIQCIQVLIQALSRSSWHIFCGSLCRCFFSLYVCLVTCVLFFYMVYTHLFVFFWVCHDFASLSNHWKSCSYPKLPEVALEVTRNNVDAGKIPLTHSIKDRGARLECCEIKRFSVRHAPPIIFAIPYRSTESMVACAWVASPASVTCQVTFK